MRMFNCLAVLFLVLVATDRVSAQAMYFAPTEQPTHHPRAIRQSYTYRSENTGFIPGSYASSPYAGEYVGTAGIVNAPTGLFSNGRHVTNPRYPTNRTIFILGGRRGR